MGLNIRLRIYDKKELIKKLHAWGASDEKLTMKILERCGSFIGDKYVLLNNGLWEGTDPYFNVSILFDFAFERDDSFNIFLHSGTDGIDSVELSGVADELGIDLRED